METGQATSHMPPNREADPPGSGDMDAGQSGTFTAVVSRYDGNDFFDPVHEREISIDSGINEIELDMALEPRVLDERRRQ